jgi:uncharacterized protein YbbC (DUF1343 family)
MRFSIHTKSLPGMAVPEMAYKKYKPKFVIFFLFLVSCLNQEPAGQPPIQTGAEQTQKYFPLLNDKRVALVGNHTSRIGNMHLADTMLSAGINLVKIFTPEHGFRGTSDAGEIVNTEVDPVSGLPVVSLYGARKKPTSADLEGIDVLIFDIQDVGVRFYTYISTLHYVMEACAENGIRLIITDRPNPNGNYIDGPVLDTAFRSFVGMHPVPVVHGLTGGEFARMINGEGWLKNGIKCSLEVITCHNYKHSDPWVPSVPPSPNLPNIQSIRLYPSLCFFEGTPVSLGRGTDFPFQFFGHPKLSGSFVFTPESRVGAVNPPLKGQECKGKDLRNFQPVSGIFDKIELQWLIEAYQQYEPKSEFFTSYFAKLAGTDELRLQIERGLSADEIRKSWVQQLEDYRILRERYLLYD